MKRRTFVTLAAAGLGSALAAEGSAAAQPRSRRPAAASQPLSHQTIESGGVTRRFSVYVPSGQPAYRAQDPKNNPLVIVIPPDDESGAGYAARTAWTRVAEDRGFIVAFPVAADGGWNIGLSADRPDDIAFVTAVTDTVRGTYKSNEINTYIAGEGAGAALANQVAAISSTRYVAVAGCGDGVPLDFYDKAASRLTVTAMSGWTFLRGPRPSAEESRQIAYWRGANKGRPHAQVRVSRLRDGRGFASTDVVEAVWDRMFHPTLRFTDQDSVNGHLVPFRTAQEMGLRWCTKTIGGASRRWLVYLPTRYRSLTRHGRRLPVVMSFHGRNGSARFHAQQSYWADVAEKYGFIAVFPQAEPLPGAGPHDNIAWSPDAAPDNTDVRVALGIVEDIDSRFEADLTRVYVTGFSQGSAFTNRLAVQYPERFAAIAPQSGHLFRANDYSAPVVRTDVPLPVWQFRGVDEVPGDFPGGSSGEAASRVFWRETVDRNLQRPRTVVDGRYTTEVFTDGVAEYRWTVNGDVGHFPPNGVNHKVWAEFFSRYRRLPDGSLEVH
ncbi:PHB depolymerase family esterase [Streptomyces sp. GbtcB7]|uniref:PHB depolymerase family esterase n=1 Tax=Streptomyces sp. GbtcB7 TaxID=2824752 RepID=UPI001C2F1C5A|nr:PHB depolymerase family esterase [Streptomyces sp. GbtcB7]